MIRQFVTIASLAWSVACLTLSCKSSAPEPQTSSETHFLRRCDNDCGGGLACLCGVCTKACTGTNECAELGDGAQCVPVVEESDAATEASCRQGATCDVACVSRTDCAALGSDYRCETGYCRLGDTICPSQILTARDEVRNIIVDGVSRTYWLHVPSTYSGKSEVPLVLDFHPMVLGVDWEQANSGYKALSDRDGFILAWPYGLENSWNIGPCCTTSKAIDDLTFARRLVRRLSIEACIDSSRIYAVGFSMGGAMAYYLGCREAEVFAAIAASSMDLPLDSELSCQPYRAISEISFRGSADTVVPYAGGTTSPPGQPTMSFNVLGAVGTFQKWSTLNHCSGNPTVSDANGCSSYITCEGGTEVTLCTTQNGGQVIGDATLGWNFLQRHPLAL